MKTDDERPNDLFDEPMEVVLVDEAVVILGPDGVAVAITADAAEASARVLRVAARRAPKNAGGGVRKVRIPPKSRRNTDVRQ